MFALPKDCLYTSDANSQWGLRHLLGVGRELLPRVPSIPWMCGVKHTNWWHLQVPHRSVFSWHIWTEWIVLLCFPVVVTWPSPPIPIRPRTLHEHISSILIPSLYIISSVAAILVVLCRLRVQGNASPVTPTVLCKSPGKSFCIIKLKQHNNH